MSTNKLSITLTEDQQKQIFGATGKRIAAIHFDPDQLSQKETDQVAGGSVSIAFADITYQYYTQ